MDVTSIRVGYGRTFSTGNFESIRLDCEIEVRPSDGEDLGGVRKAAEVMAEESVRDRYLAYLQRQKERAGVVINPPVADPPFQAKVKQSQEGPSIVKPPAQGGAGTAVKSPGDDPNSIESRGY